MSPRQPRRPRTSRAQQNPPSTPAGQPEPTASEDLRDRVLPAALAWLVANVVSEEGGAETPTEYTVAVRRLLSSLDADAIAVLLELFASEQEPTSVNLERIRALLGVEALVHQAGADDPVRVAEILASARALDPDQRRALFEASLRAQLGAASPEDSALISNHLSKTAQPEMEGSNPMVDYSGDGYGAQSYTADTSNLRSVPAGWADNFAPAIQRVLETYSSGAAPDRVLTAAIAGMLLLDGNYDYTTPTFSSAITGRLLPYVVSPLLDRNGQKVGGYINLDAFKRADAAIYGLRQGGAAFYQELATAGRQIIDGQRGSIVAEEDQILLKSAVQAALQSYGSGGSTTGSFDLPPLTTGVGPDELIPDHISAVGMILAGYELETAGLFQALQRSLEIFMDGQLPVAYDQAGQALNAYYWDQINQMTESARWMQYSRVLGVAGGELPKDVQPNHGLMDNLMGFVSSLSEYDRQQRVADMLGQPRALNLTGEHVRKAGRDLGAACTLYGYGYTQFGAKKLQTQIQTALNIFKLPDFQAAWGVQGAWQAIQRIMSQEFQKTPNVVKQRTLAESGKAILDLIASNSGAWSGTSGNPLFQIDGAAGDISDPDRLAFMRHAEFIIAVSGTSDADVSANAAPKDTPAIATIPSLDGSSANGKNADVAGQIQAMLNQNQTPTPDQLRKLIGV